MLKDAKAFSSFSVNDIQEAKKFYGEVLGLEVKEEYGGLTLHTKGNEGIMVYPKDNHEPGTFTVLNFSVPDIEKAVDELTEKGVKLEKYEEEELKTNEKGISVAEGWPKMAWFKDPAGNFLALMQV